jgi:hypothetical protein
VEEPDPDDLRTSHSVLDSSWPEMWRNGTTIVIIAVSRLSISITSPEMWWFYMVQYRAFGLSFYSDVIISQLLADHGPIDARIELGKTPKTLPNPIFETKWCQVSDTECLIHIDGVANYHVAAGQRITVEPQPDVEAHMVHLWLLGSAMSALLHQRGILPLHASAVEVANNGILICGASGSGKSTMAAGFLRRGYRLISDDVSALGLDDDGKVVVYPAYPQQKLWQDTLDNLEISPANLVKLRYYESKYALSRQESFCDQARYVRAIYLLEYGNEEKITVQPVIGVPKLDSLREHIYRPFFMPRNVFSTSIKTLALLAAQVRLVKVSRPPEGFWLEDIVSRILDDLEILDQA